MLTNDACRMSATNKHFSTSLMSSPKAEKRTDHPANVHTVTKAQNTPRVSTLSGGHEQSKAKRQHGGVALQNL